MFEFEFSGKLWYWRGPAPFHFVTVPDDESAIIAEDSPSVTYGWGMIPCTARIGDTEWETSLFPKDGRYILPVKAAVRGAEGLEPDDTTAVRVTIRAAF